MTAAGKYVKRLIRKKMEGEIINKNIGIELNPSTSTITESITEYFSRISDKQLQEELQQAKRLELPYRSTLIQIEIKDREKAKLKNVG